MVRALRESFVTLTSKLAKKTSNNNIPSALHSYTSGYSSPIAPSFAPPGYPIIPPTQVPMNRPSTESEATITMKEVSEPILVSELTYISHGYDQYRSE